MRFLIGLEETNLLNKKSELANDLMKLHMQCDTEEGNK